MRFPIIEIIDTQYPNAESRIFGTNRHDILKVDTQKGILQYVNLQSLASTEMSSKLDDPPKFTFGSIDYGDGELFVKMISFDELCDLVEREVESNTEVHNKVKALIFRCLDERDIILSGKPYQNNLMFKIPNVTDAFNFPVIRIRATDNQDRHKTHIVGTDVHDTLIVDSHTGGLEYCNIQCDAGTKFYSFETPKYEFASVDYGLDFFCVEMVPFSTLCELELEDAKKKVVQSQETKKFMKIVEETIDQYIQQWDTHI